MPQDELKQFGLSDEDIAERRFSPQFRDFMKFQAARTHRLYDEANAGIFVAQSRRPLRRCDGFDALPRDFG